MQRKPFYMILYVQVLAAIVAGVLLGHFMPHAAVTLKPLGDLFIKLVRMIIGPVIFCTVVTGIAGMQDMKKVGRVGGKALIYFEVASTIALAIGLLAAHVTAPGQGFNVDPSTLDVRAVSGYAAQAAHGDGIAGFIAHVIPETFVGALVQGDILPVLLIAMLFGTALALMGETAAPITRSMETLSKAFFRIVGMVTSLAPLGAFGAMAFTIGRYGIVSLLPMLKLIGAFYLTAFLFVAVVLGAVARLCGFSLWRFLAYIRDELLIVLGTSTSEAALPQLMDKLGGMGCPRGVVGLVVPTGYSFNLDGTNIYMTLAVLFLAQATNTHLSFGQEVTLLLVTMLTSKGSTGVTGAGFITLAASLSVVPTVPASAMVLILGIDRFMSECRALTNIVGNGVATIVVSAWEGELDRTKLAMALGNEEQVRGDSRSPGMRETVAIDRERSFTDDLSR